MTESNPEKSIYSDYSIAEIKRINAFTLPHVVRMGQWRENPTPEVNGIVLISKRDLLRKKMARGNK